MTQVIRTPDHRLRVFISSTLDELAEERCAARDAVRRLQLAPVMFEAGARPHPPRDVYRSYLSQSHLFIGIYSQRYGWIAPGETASGLEDEYLLARDLPKLIYVKEPAPQRDQRLIDLLARIESDDTASYRPFATANELIELVENDLAVVLTERFERSFAGLDAVEPAPDESVRPAPAHVLRAVTPLVGRRREIDDVLRLVGRDDVRLVTLTGPGGIGKSRVALAVAEQVQSGGQADVVWVDLAGTREARLVDSTIAGALGLPETPRQSVLESVAAHLAAGSHLLVLDNFEHVLAAAPLVTHVLRRCPATTVLVTSRSILNLRGEHDVVIPPLLVPSEDNEVTDAVTLFADRARSVNQSFRITDENLPAVAATVRRLDGLPLAIELAAARTRLLTPAALLARLDSRLRTLTGGARDLPPRQQTLRAALDWDYDLLDGQGRALFRRLSAFAGGFTLDAAEAVASATEPVVRDVFDEVASLVNKSLLRAGVGASGQPRFSMLETVREYAHELLETSGEAAPVHVAHAVYFIEQVRSTFLRGHDQVDQLAALEEENSNFRAALDRAAEHGDIDVELRLVIELTPFWEIHGHLREGSTRVEAALVRSATRRDAARVRALLAAVVFARSRGELVHARELADEALDIARELKDDALVAWSLKTVGMLLQECGSPEESVRYDVEALALFERLGDDSGAGRVLNNLAMSYLDLGRYDDAIEYLRRRYERGGSLGDAVGSTRSFQNIGLAHLVAGRSEIAERVLVRALARFLMLGSSWDVADCLDFLASAVAANGRFDVAATLVGASEALHARIGAPRLDHVVEGYRDGVLLLHSMLSADELEQATTAGAALRPADLVGYLATVVDPRLVDVGDRGIDTELLREACAPVDAAQPSTVGG